MAAVTRFGFVTNKSSPTIWIFSPIFSWNAEYASQSSWSKGFFDRDERVVVDPVLVVGDHLLPGLLHL